MVARHVAEDTARGGKLGDCALTSMALSRILEAERIWNYVVKGAVVVTAPGRPAIPPAYFYSVDPGPADLAHAWVIAPPFAVVDASLRHQNYVGSHARMRGLVPELVISEEATPASSDPKDVFSPEARAICALKGIGMAALLERVRPHLPEFFRCFPPYQVSAEGLVVRYVPCAVAMALEPLDELHPPAGGRRTSPTSTAQRSGQISRRPARGDRRRLRR